MDIWWYLNVAVARSRCPSLVWLTPASNNLCLHSPHESSRSSLSSVSIETASVSASAIIAINLFISILFVHELKIVSCPDLAASHHELVPYQKSFWESSKARPMKKSVMKTSAKVPPKKSMKAMKATKAGSKRKPSAPSSSKTSKKKPAASKNVAKKPAAMKSQRKSRSLKALRKVTEAQSLRSFKSAVAHVVDINRLGVLHVDWLRRLVDGHCGYCDVACDKLEILLNAGLDVDTPGLLHSSVAGSDCCLCFHMLLDYGADPVGGPGDQTSGRCPFVAAVLNPHVNQIQNLLALKEALMEHPRRQARHEEEWREAVERIHEGLLQESGRRFFGIEKKWLRDQVLQYVDPKYAVSPPAPPAHPPFPEL